MAKKTEKDVRLGTRRQFFKILKTDLRRLYPTQRMLNEVRQTIYRLNLERI